MAVATHEKDERQQEQEYIQTYYSSSKQQQQETPKKSWSSLLTIDPTKILAHLVNRGGLVLPHGASKHLEIARKVMGVQHAELNIVSRDLVLHNLTVREDDSSEPALRIGRTAIRWDGYVRPTLDVLVDGVEVLVEFTNVMLTENNWSVLQAMGFPPEIKIHERKGKVFDDVDNAFIRFHDIILRGDFAVRVTSRPLGKEIGVMKLDMRDWRDLSKEIRSLSDTNLQSTGRAGCTVTELSAVIQRFISRKVRFFVKTRVNDLAKNPKSALEKADDFLNRASSGVMDYVGDVGRLKGGELQQAATKQLENWGLPEPSSVLTSIKDRTVYAVRRLNVTAIRDYMDKEVSTVLENLHEMRENLKTVANREDESEFLFPDW